MIWIGSKIWKAPMNVMTLAKKIVGDIIGMVTFHILCQAFAPSIRAASCSWSGTVCSPANMITKVKPTVCHQSMPMMAGRAHCGSVNQFGVGIPICWR